MRKVKEEMVQYLVGNELRTIEMSQRTIERINSGSFTREYVDMLMDEELDDADSRLSHVLLDTARQAIIYAIFRKGYDSDSAEVPYLQAVLMDDFIAGFKEEFLKDVERFAVEALDEYLNEESK